MTTLLWLAVALPLGAALLTRSLSRLAGPVAALGAVVAAAPAWLLLTGAGRGETASTGLEWLPGGGLTVGLRLDGLSAAMSATVATVGLVVVVYAAGYFAADPRRPSALAGLLGFLAAMQGLVLADGYLALLVFWELVGVASVRLIAYSRDDPAAPPAAVRAFLTTRSADLGLYLAVFALFDATGSVAFGAERPDGALGAVVGIGLVVAAAGKSAQVPLQTWLSAAMAGPTPVSALLHSATMVAAGVYLLMRSATLLDGWPLELAGWLGAVTAVAGAAIALAQDDLKRVLAGSTTSQLGLMFVGVAAAGPAVALFHLVAHAAGKAGLFLAAGVFGHARGGTALEALRGAGRDDRATFAGFAVCALSIAAVPPLAAFWSKEHIAAGAEGNAGWLVLVLIAGAGSAAYLLRPTLILWDRAAGDARRATVGRATMLAGVAVAAAASLGLGATGTPLAHLLDEPPLPTSTLSLALSLAAIAIGAAAVLARVPVPRAIAAAARRQLGVNEALRGAVQRPFMALSAAANGLDRRGLDAAVDGVGRGGLAIARVHDRLDRRGLDAAVDGLGRGGLVIARVHDRVERGIDRLVDGLAGLVGRSGSDLRRLQTGRLYEYLRDAVLGVVTIALLLALTALT